MPARFIAAARLAALVALEAAAIPLLHASRTPGDSIDWSHLDRWLATTAPEDAVVAVVRLVAMVLAVWLLATTMLYLLARLTAVPALVRGTEWATLPGVRRVVDAAVAASVMGGAVTGIHPAGAQVSSPPPIVVELHTTTTSVPGHLYVPVPAGDAAAPTTTTASVAPTTARPSAAVTTTPPPPARSASAPDPTPAQAQEPAPHVHTVVSGDNLWTIAAAELSRQTGRAAEADIRDYWLQVIDANRETLLSGDPNLIYPGESIRCPIVG